METLSLNYTTRAIDGLLLQSRHLWPIAPMTAAITEKLAHDLRGAVKFILPDEGVIFAAKRKAGTVPDLDLFRLPFPVTVVEFQMHTPESLTHKSGVEILSACRRLAIAYDMSVPVVRDEWLKLGIKKLDYDGVLIWPINDISGADPAEVAATGGWTPNWCGGFIPADAVAALREVSSLPPDIREEFEKLNPGITKTGYFNYNPIPCGEAGLAVEHDFVARGVLDAMITRDIIHEVNAVMDLGIAMACRNVRREVIPAPLKLNAKRQRTGKTPFYDYHVLTIDLPGRIGGGSIGTTVTGRSSPRGHLRRGHVRRLDSGPIWINSTVVNPGSDFLGKDYKVRG